MRVQNDGEEIRDPGDLSSPAPTTDRELDLAELLMTEMTGVEVFFTLSVSHETRGGVTPTELLAWRLAALARSSRARQAR